MKTPNEVWVLLAAPHTVHASIYPSQKEAEAVAAKAMEENAAIGPILVMQLVVNYKRTEPVIERQVMRRTRKTKATPPDITRPLILENIPDILVVEGTLSADQPRKPHGFERFAIEPLPPDKGDGGPLLKPTLVFIPEGAVVTPVSLPPKPRGRLRKAPAAFVPRFPVAITLAANQTGARDGEVVLQCSACPNPFTTYGPLPILVCMNGHEMGDAS